MCCCNSIHVIDLTAGGPPAMELLAIPGRGALFPISGCAFHRVILHVEDGVGLIPGLAEGFNDGDSI